ncbi:MAG: hypothetical protein ACE5IL_12980, partial [Myxococcota bacterium]
MRRHGWVRSLGLVLAVASLPALGLGAQALRTARIPGTRVTLSYPPGFSVVEYGTALHVPNAPAWIRVSEIRIPIQERIAATRRGLAKAKDALEMRDVRIGPYEGLYLRTKVRAGAGRVWSVIFGNERESVRIVATGPEKLAPLMGPQYEKMLLDARWQPGRPLNPYEALPFVLPRN